MLSAFSKKGFPYPGLSLAVVLFLLFTACAVSKRDILYLNEQIVALNERVNKLEGSMDEMISGKLEPELQAVREDQADLGAEMDRVKDEMRELSGRVQEYERVVQRAVERDTTDQDQMKADVSELLNRVSELERLVQASSYKGKLQTSEKEAALPSTPGEGPEEEPVPRKAEEKPLTDEEALYSKYMSILKEGKYEEAISGFRDFLDKYPDSNLADNAQFWIGECYMDLKMYEQAILAYQKVIKRYSKGNKVANAMLRQAVAFHEIEDKISARLLLKKLIKDFPNSSEAKIAEAKLKTMN